LIAPAGTRTRTGAIGNFKKGGFVVALQTGASIIPVGIRDSEQIHRPDTSDLFMNRHVHISIGKPLDASRYTMDMRDQHMEDVKRSIVSLI
jgi:1-acyl-sn-glycerol-3-phosphate acyltransferase